MSKQMLIDATHPEEIRVAVVDGKKLEEFDVEVASRKPLKGNIYLAKVTRVEPSLQAAFVEYGGNRHGFLAFSEIHPDYYRIPVADREALKRETSGLDSKTPNDNKHANQQTLAEAIQVEKDDRLIAEMIDSMPETEQDALLGIDQPMDNILTAEDADLSATATPSETEGLFFSPEEIAPPILALDQQGDAHTSADITSSTDRGPNGPLADDPEADEEMAKRRRMRALRRYKIQEVIKRRQIMLIQVTKEERGNKGAALTTYLSLAGRYCVLMPNTDRGGGISRRIVSPLDRKRLKSIIDELDPPAGIAVILRTAGSERSKIEIRRDYEYLLRLWDDIRELTFESKAPALIYEEANLIKRSIRDLYTRDIENITVAGDDAHKAAKEFMRMLMPSHAKRVRLYKDMSIPLFQRFQIESQVAAIHDPVVQLKSGGYIVINQTEALVAIDVNSGRATRERNIEETALKTNLEAADEVARQLRLRDLAGLVVVDFIDMEENRHNISVEKRMKDALRNDRARIQLGRISVFGLFEMSRQRLNPSLSESSTGICPHCNGTGRIRSVDSTALHILRMVEEELARQPAPGANIFVPSTVALYILNQKRLALAFVEQRHGTRLYVIADESLVPPAYRLERLMDLAPGEAVEKNTPPVQKNRKQDDMGDIQDDQDDADDDAAIDGDDQEDDGAPFDAPSSEEGYAPSILGKGSSGGQSQDDDRDPNSRRRRRGRRGGRRRGRNRDDQSMADAPPHSVSSVSNAVETEHSSTPRDHGDQPQGASADAAPENQDASAPRRRGRRDFPNRKRRNGPKPERKSELEHVSTENAHNPMMPDHSSDIENPKPVRAALRRADNPSQPLHSLNSAAIAEPGERQDTPKKKGWWRKLVE